MEIADNTVVSFDYTLKDASGNVIDSSKGSDPLTYIHGGGALIPGLARALEGKSAGASFSVRVPADEAYGERDDELIEVVPRDRFDASLELAVGMQFEARDENERRIVTIIEIEGDAVTLDANHPLAGAELHFDVTVKSVRAATPEELTHGHVHGPGGHHH